jgi:hypothetical protein
MDESGDLHGELIVRPAGCVHRWVAYIYYMRFSIFLWAALFPGLILLEFLAPGLTRGIFALERPVHFFLTAFFVTVADSIALLTARVVCAYGEERFNIPPPDAFKIGEDVRWRTFLLAHSPGWLLLVFIGYVSIAEAHRLQVFCDFITSLLGIVSALAMWAVVSLAYYWTRESDDVSPRSSANSDELQGARAFFLPHFSKWSVVRRIHCSPPPPISKLSERFFNLVAAWFGPGFFNPYRTPLSTSSRIASWLSRHSPVS